MALYLGGKEVIIQEVPVLPEEVIDAHYLKMDMEDEATKEWWSLYKWENKLFKRKAKRQ